MISTPFSQLIWAKAEDLGLEIKDMGGFGSGGHNRRRRYLEQFRKLDAAHLQKHGLLCDGWRGTLNWSNQDGSEASIRVEGGRNQIVLSYRAQLGDSDWTPVNERFAVDWSVRHFGGAQAYLRCRGCGRRVRLLMLANLRFRCRICHGIVHASSQEQPGNRASRKNQRLRAKLGASQALGDHVPRPKGMHQTTYQRYLDRILDAECEINDDILRVLARFQKTDIRLRTTIRDFWQ